MNATDSLTQKNQSTGLLNLAQGNLGVPVLLLTILGMMTLPIPPFLLDVFFSFNIAIAIVVILVAAYALRPLDFAVFPTVLLVSTLLRLALNVASTRVVLLEGHQGGDAAGKVIQSFGEVVIGGNYAVGLVVFLILVIINFVVVTKGAGRIAEVSARFTLDAMPGKQMAIDADLNSGLINQEDAKARRVEIASEADFYGSMDGASKFVRGDAVAGIMILFINIIGGLAIGMVQHELEFARAMEVYSLLTIGDGLVAQIPGLLLSTSAAIMVTRVSSSKDMGEQINSQMFESPKALAVTSAIVGFMGVIPGMPHVAFLTLAAITGGAAYMISQRKEKVEVERVAVEQAQQVQEQQQQQVPKVPEIGWDDVQPVDAIGLEVGYRLIPMVDKAQGGELLSRIKGIRKKLSQDIGFLIPSVHIRDNLDLMPTAYRITLTGVTAGGAEIYPDRDLAINPGQVFGKIDGIPTTDPAFGLEALWIDPGMKDQAQTLGYTVVDASTVVATHINQLLLKHTHELLGHDEVQQMLDMLAKHAPKLVENLVPDTVSMNVMLAVLKNLLMEQVPIRDLRTIAEAVSANAHKSQDIVALTGAVRVALRRTIIQSIYGNEDVLPAIALDPAMEQLLLKSLQNSQQNGITDDIVLEPGLAEKIQVALRDATQRQELAGKPAVLLVSAPLRAVMVKFIRYSSVDMQVLSYGEIPDDKQITIESTVG
ncbi:flagellar biosynthesis protein FlhA [Oceanicoccus sp. KOV_DT_Chl]|uniref:flagellar biosynthesis protein FlhA n=1 Tax=Oceanicoccus sp. KOV_DT_Chl TaxID=1904639 RepID=UPI000C7C8E15|nr:flagellar biosynthesis protein FlhA [Oceanicoccus sp. KOV_DT_Chl]